MIAEDRLRATVDQTGSDIVMRARVLALSYRILILIINITEGLLYFEDTECNPLLQWDDSIARLCDQVSIIHSSIVDLLTMKDITTPL
jgi:hypothetical protein